MRSSLSSTCRKFAESMNHRWIALFTSAAFAFGLMGSRSYAESETTAEPRFSLGGRIYTDQYFSTRSDSGYSGGVIQSSYSAWLDFKARPSDRSTFTVVGQFDTFLKNMTENSKASFSPKIREAFFSFQNESTDFRIGQQIIPWGKSDGVNPTDYFSAKDFTLLNPDEEVKRLGAPALQLNYTPKNGASPVTFTGIFQAAYPAVKLMIPERAVPSGILFQKYPSAPTLFRDDTIEYGGKIAYLGNTFDFSISAYRGVNHFAQYVFDSSINQVSPKNIQQSAVGADLSFTSGSYVVRAESAYFIPDQGPKNTALHGVLQPEHWDTIIGVERSFFDDFRAQIQFLYRYHLDWLDPASISTPLPALTSIQQTLARANALLLNYQRASNPGATFRVGYASDSSDWTADLFLVGYFAQGYDFLLRPQLSYQPAEGWKWTAGADWYGGNESRPLGALAKNSSLFLEGRYLF
jgi:hypothetical protein